MASHSFCNSSFFVCLLLISLCSTLAFCQNDLIIDTCKQARNPSLCFKSLISDSRSSEADLPTLGFIAIEKAQARAIFSINLIKSLAKPIRRIPTIKEIYETCSEIYSDALDNLDSAKKFLESQDFLSLNSFASAVITDADTCDQGFEERIVHEPPKLMHAGHELEDLADVILVISKKLAGENNF